MRTGWLLIVLRSVPELVWALVFVRVVGLGPTAGVLAIALTYGGMLGKVYSEILESGEKFKTIVENIVFCHPTIHPKRGGPSESLNTCCIVNMSQW